MINDAVQDEPEPVLRLVQKQFTMLLAANILRRPYKTLTIALFVEDEK